MNAGDLHSYYVRSDSGQMIPLDNLVTVAESAGPPVISHYIFSGSVEIDGSAAPGLIVPARRWRHWTQLASANTGAGMTYQWTALDA